MVSNSARSRVAVAISLILLLLAAMAALAAAQNAPAPQKPKPEVPEAGGPAGDIGPIAIPKKNEDEKPEKPAPPPKNPEGMPDFSLRVDVPVVTLDAIVTTKDGHFIPGLKREHFRVLEDGVPQTLKAFQQTEAPVTAVLLIEFASTNYEFMYDALNAAYTFASTLKPDDWIAVVSYDMKTFTITDFTQDKRAVFGALNQLRIPGFRETNLFDALYDTVDRLERIDGKKYVVLISSGRDTFSRINYDTILKKLRATQNISIYSISTGRALREWIDARYGHNIEVRAAMMDYLQGDNQMNTFAKYTGGRWYNPRFMGELPEIFRDVAASIRNQYTLTYTPSNSAQDGKYRKIKIELVDPQDPSKPLKVVNEKGKEMKVQVIAREGYTAKNVVD